MPIFILFQGILFLLLLNGSYILVADTTVCSLEEISADLFILLDASGSMKKDNFVKQVQAVHNLVDSFHLGPQHVQVGFATFSSYVHLQGTMNRYNKENDPAKLKYNTLRLVDYIITDYEGGGTKTAKALQYVMDNSFTAAAGDRTGVPNILIVMTDGASDDKTETLAAARKLHDEGIICIAIGIGNNKTLDLEELEGMASNESFAYPLESFDLLGSLLSTLKAVICKAGVKVTYVETSTTETTGTEEISTFGITLTRLYTGKPSKLQKGPKHSEVTEEKKHTADQQLGGKNKQRITDSQITTTKDVRRHSSPQGQVSRRSPIRNNTSSVSTSEVSTLVTLTGGRTSRIYKNKGHDNPSTKTASKDPTFMTKYSTEYRATFLSTKSYEDDYNGNNDDNREYLSNFRSSALVQSAEIGSIAVISVVAMGAALCCCKKICCGKIDEDNEDEKSDVLFVQRSSQDSVNSFSREQPTKINKAHRMSIDM